MREKLADCNAPDLLALEAMGKVAALFDSPSRNTKDEALRALEAMESGLAAYGQNLRIDLQLLKNALMDEESVLGSSTRK